MGRAGYLVTHLEGCLGTGVGGGCRLWTEACYAWQEREQLLLTKGQQLTPGLPIHQTHHHRLKPGSCLGSTVSMEGEFFFLKKGRLKSEKNIICQKRDLCSQKATLYPKSLPQNSFWSLAFRISRYAFSLIRIGSRQNSEVSEMSIEPHPNNTLR